MHFEKKEDIANNPKIFYDSYNSDSVLANCWQYLTIIIIMSVIVTILNIIQPSFSSNESSILKWRKYMTFNVPIVYFYLSF